jgi:hypothetical protein
MQVLADPSRRQHDCGKIEQTNRLADRPVNRVQELLP